MANPKGLSVEPTSGLPTVGQSPSGVDPAGEPANGAIESSPAPASVPAGPHFLESEWVMWEHRAPDKNSKSYEDNMAKLCEFATIEDFWRLWNNVPKPSAIFYDGRTKKKFKDRTVESFSLFKKGIKPEWEDAANRTGAEWFCRKTFPMPQLVSTPFCSAPTVAPMPHARAHAPCPCPMAMPMALPMPHAMTMPMSSAAAASMPAAQPSRAEPRLRLARRTASGRTSCSAWWARPSTLRTRSAALAVSAPRPSRHACSARPARGIATLGAARSEWRRSAAVDR